MLDQSAQRHSRSGFRGAPQTETPLLCSRRHRPALICRAAGSQTQPATDPDKQNKRLLVRVPETRQPAEAPAPVPVQHSTSFLVRGRHSTVEDDLPSVREEEEEPFTGNAIQWGLRKWDKRMKEQELNPSSSTQTAWRVGAGPIGSAAGKGVSGAARASLAVGQEAFKAAVPAGKWALGQSVGLAWKLAAGARSRHYMRASSWT